MHVCKYADLRIPRLPVGCGLSGPGVTIVDVFARDGLQTLVHEPELRQPTTGQKADVVAALDRAGVPEIEITGFVHPRVIPSLADAEEVAALVLARPHRARYRALVPNLRGAQRAVDAGVPKIVALIAASPTYQRLNSNMSVEENLAEIESIAELARGHGVELALGMAIGFICPYEGVMPFERIAAILERAVDLGIREVSLADSVGLAWPTLVRERCLQVKERWPDLELGLHLHTLAGLALANAWAAYGADVTRFEGAVGGIGGGIAMPVHTTSMGNVATEDLVYLFESCRVATGIDQAAIARLGNETRELIGAGGGHVGAFGTLDAFLQVNRGELERLSAAPVGSSRARRAAP